MRSTVKILTPRTKVPNKPKITDSTWYTLVDLAIRSVSAIGLLIIGYAGWKLQSKTQEQQEYIRSQETEARRYLPPLQALAQLQVALSFIGDQSQFSLDEMAKKTANLGWRVTFLDDSLHFPNEYSPSVGLTPLAEYEHYQTRKHSVTVPFKDAAAMAANFLPMLASLQDPCHRSEKSDHPESIQFQKVELKYGPPALYFSQREGVSLPGDQFIQIESSGATVWSKLFPKDGVNASDFCQLPFGILFQELARGAGDISADILAHHPELSERAVAMRIETLKMKNDFLGSP